MLFRSAWDVIDIRQAAHETGAHFIGPASSGLLVPRCVKAGFYVDEICLPGPVGVITKSGSLSYAVLAEMKSQGIGVSTVVATGGERIKGMNFVDLLPHFLADPKTEALVLLGEIGGSEEEQAAEFLSQHQQKPVVAFISGRSVPMGQSLGHAGAMAQKGRGDYASKANAFRRAGASVADNIGQIPQLLREMLNSAA